MFTAIKPWLIVELSGVLWLLILAKHLLVDFCLQTVSVATNKGDLLKPHAYWHGFQHLLGTVMVVFLIDFTYGDIFSTKAEFLSTLGGLLMVEFASHVLTDATKVNICNKYDWRCNTSEEYWWMTGLDQFIHQVVYIYIITTLLKSIL